METKSDVDKAVERGRIKRDRIEQDEREDRDASHAWWKRRKKKRALENDNFGSLAEFMSPSPSESEEEIRRRIDRADHQAWLTRRQSERARGRARAQAQREPAGDWWRDQAAERPSAD